MAEKPTPKNAGPQAVVGDERPVSKSMRGQIKTYELPTPRSASKITNTRRYLILGLLGALALSVLLVGGALLQLFVLAPRETVSAVGGVSIGRAQVQNRVKLDYANLVSRYQNLQGTVQQAQASGDEQSQFLVQFYQQQLQQLVPQFDASQIARNSLNGLVSEQIVRQEAAKRGIVASNDDVQGAIEEQFGFRVAPLPAPTDGSPPAPPATPVPEATFRDSYNRVVDYYKTQGLGENDLRSLFELRVIEGRLKDTFGAELPKSDVQYRFNYLRLYSETVANDILVKAQAAPAGFTALISSTNAVTETNMGDGDVQDWMLGPNLSNRYGEDVLAALNGAPVGQVTGVFSPAANSFYVVQPVGRENRPLNKTDLDAAAQTAFSDWLKKQEADPAVVSAAPTTDLSSMVPKTIRDQITNFRQQVSRQ